VAKAQVSATHHWKSQQPRISFMMLFCDCKKRLCCYFIYSSTLSTTLKLDLLFLLQKKKTFSWERNVCYLCVSLNGCHNIFEWVRWFFFQHHWSWIWFSFLTQKMTFSWEANVLYLCVSLNGSHVNLDGIFDYMTPNGTKFKTNTHEKLVFIRKTTIAQRNSQRTSFNITQKG